MLFAAELDSLVGLKNLLEKLKLETKFLSNVSTFLHIGH